MSRFVVRYQGKGQAPARDLARVRAAARVVDEAERMLLVELDERAAAGLSRRLAGWLVTPEVAVPRPEPRVRVQRPPSRRAGVRRG